MTDNPKPPQKVEVVAPNPIPVTMVEEIKPILTDEDRRQTVVAPPNNLQYVLAILFMMMLGVVSIVVISVARPSVDNTNLITTIIGFLAPTTLSLLAFMKAQETHLSVNSRLDAFMSNAKLSARAQGRAEGRQLADARTDLLAGR